MKTSVKLVPLTTYPTMTALNAIYAQLLTVSLVLPLNSVKVALLDLNCMKMHVLLVILMIANSALRVMSAKPALLIILSASMALSVFLVKLRTVNFVLPLINAKTALAAFTFSKILAFIVILKIVCPALPITSAPNASKPIFSKTIAAFFQQSKPNNL